eukprot:8543464-Pyramimonas_sp.AAC.1
MCISSGRRCVDVNRRGNRIRCAGGPSNVGLHDLVHSARLTTGAAKDNVEVQSPAGRTVRAVYLNSLGHASTVRPGSRCPRTV